MIIKERLVVVPIFDYITRLNRFSHSYCEIYEMTLKIGNGSKCLSRFDIYNEIICKKQNPPLALSVKCNHEA